MKEVISLGVGEPDFITPWPIREAGIYSLEQGFTSYTSNKGLYKLRLGISRYLNHRFNLNYCPEEEILITVGASEGMDLTLRAIIEPQDQILIPSPSYVSYGPVTELAGGVPVYIDTKSDNFKLRPEKLNRFINKKTKALILNYPTNPTGVSYSRTELMAFHKILTKHNLLCISDEIYGDLSYDFDHIPFVVLPGAKNHTVLLDGFSKSYAMTGWRVGYACGPKEIIAAMTKIHQYTIMCVSITSQMAASEALVTGRRAVDKMKREYRRRREFIVEELNRSGLICPKPQGAFYVFPSIVKCRLSSLEFASRLLEEEKVAVVPGVAFGSKYDDYVRMSYATNYAQLKEAIQRIKNFVNRYTQRKSLRGKG